MQEREPRMLKIKKNLNYLITLFTFMLTTTSVNAQQGFTAADVPKIDSLVPLEEYLSRPEKEQIPFYAFQRCAGLFLGYKYYAGATFDAEKKIQTDTTTANLGIAALLIEVNQIAERRGDTLNDLKPEFISEIQAKSSLQVQAFAFFYDDRMKANFLANGAAFSEDPLIAGDLTICGSFAEAATSIVNQD
jgi:hypothetical protein